MPQEYTPGPKAHVQGLLPRPTYIVFGYKDPKVTPTRIIPQEALLSLYGLRTGAVDLQNVESSAHEVL